MAISFSLLQKSSCNWIYISTIYCCLFRIIFSAKKTYLKQLNTTCTSSTLIVICQLSTVCVRGTEPPDDLHLMAQISARLRLLLEAALIEGN